MPPLLETLKAADPKDYNEVDVRYVILDLFRIRGDKSAMPYLWHLSASKKYPPIIRQKARQTLASMLNVAEERLPDPVYTLTTLAEKYYRHQVPFRHVIYDPKSEAQFVKFWAWNKGQALARQPELKSVSEMEHFFAMRHAREALDLNPNYRPAEKILLTLILDRTYRNSLDQFLLKPMPADLHSLLATTDADLLIEVLQEALNEHNVPVILPLVQALGERGETRAVLPSVDGSPRALAKALYYPDRRVQLAAVRSVLSLPGDLAPALRARVVDILQQFLLAGPAAKALVIHTPEGQEMHVRDAVKQAGYEPVLVPGRKQALAMLHRSADYDLILTHHSYPPNELPYLLAELRADAGVGLLPVLVLAPAKAAEQMKLLVSKYRNVYPVPDGLTTMPDDLKKEMQNLYRLSKAPDFVQDVPAPQRPRVVGDILANKSLELSAAERKLLSAEAMDVLWRMSHGTFKNYSLAPARGALMAATQSKELAEKAIDTLASLPGADVQQRLAGIALDASADKKLRLIASFQLHQHILKHSLLLNSLQMTALREAYATTADPDLRKQFALLVSHLPPGKSGPKLSEFTPAPVK
jgi:hypothetical protein